MHMYIKNMHKFLPQYCEPAILPLISTLSFSYRSYHPQPWKNLAKNHQRISKEYGTRKAGGLRNQKKYKKEKFIIKFDVYRIAVFKVTSI